uniref:Uncharacterized protein n=1 Tax=Heterorhabditis bacteriophora TaxID=37862 RepID=A0A1I7XAI1_HETBA
MILCYLLDVFFVILSSLYSFFSSYTIFPHLLWRQCCVINETLI